MHTQDYSINKSNLAIRAINNLTIFERKIFNHIIFAFEQENWGDNPVVLKNSTLQSFTNKDLKHDDLKKSFKSLLTKPLEIIDNEKMQEYEATCYISHVKVNRLFTTVNMDRALKNLLDINYTNCKGVKNTKLGYSNINLEIENRLKNIHAMPMYELLISKSALKNGITISFDELYKIFGNGKKSYKAFKTFVYWVIKPSIEQINKFTNLKVGYEVQEKCIDFQLNRKAINQ